MTQVHGYGAYVPLYRIERADVAQQRGGYAGGGETAVPAHDENVVTLGVNAAENALAHAGLDGGDVDAVFAATTSDPFDERGVAAHVGYAVGAEGDVRTGDLQGSARAATDALLAARDAVAAGRTALVVAADVLRADPDSDALGTAGAGAGAVVLGDGDGVAAVEGTASNTTGFVGRFKHGDGSPVGGDDRYNRKNYLEAVTGAAERLEADPDHAVLPDPDGGWGDRAAGSLDLDAETHDTFDQVGSAGAGGVLLDLAAGLDAAEDGETLLLASYGPGGSDAVSLTVTDATTPEMTVKEYLDSKEYVPYAKHLSNREPLGGGA